MTHRPGCLAVRCCDQEACGFCGLQWDVDDPDPPACRRGELEAPRFGEYDEAQASIPVHTRRNYKGDIEVERLDPILNDGAVRYRKIASPSWQILVERRAWVRPRDDPHGPRQPGSVLLRLRVDDHIVGVLAAFRDDHHGRGDCWEFAAVVGRVRR